MKSVEATNEKLAGLISLMDHIDTQLKEILNNGNFSDDVFFRLRDDHISFLNLKRKSDVQSMRSMRRGYELP